MTENENKDLVKTSLYLDKNRWRLLKAKLALAGLSVSAWMRVKIDEYVNPKKGGQK